MKSIFPTSIDGDLLKFVISPMVSACLTAPNLCKSVMRRRA